MKKILFFVLAVPVILSGCNDNKKKAEILFQRAELSFKSENYSLAKLQIDSIRMLFPKEVDVRKAGISLMQQIDMKEQYRTLAYLDSMMQIKQLALDSIKGRYTFEKDSVYQEVGNYFYPMQVVEKNIGRSFLRAQVNEIGEMSLTSIYTGGNNIHHTAVKVSINDGTFAETPVSNDSYETTILGRVIEQADYKVGKDGGVAAYIVAHQDKKIRLEFIGDRNYTVIMSSNDVKAVVEISNLARILAAMEEIRKEQKEANLKLRFVERKIQESKVSE